MKSVSYASAEDTTIVNPVLHTQTLRFRHAPLAAVLPEDTVQGHEFSLAKCSLVNTPWRSALWLSARGGRLGHSAAHDLLGGAGGTATPQYGWSQD